MAEVILPAPVKARIVEDIDAEDWQAGDVEFLDKEDGRATAVWYNCPCGCKRQGFLKLRPAPSPSWDFDGNRTSPTLSPSVHHVGHWHGWLRGGMWVQA